MRKIATLLLPLALLSPPGAAQVTSPHVGYAAIGAGPVRPGQRPASLEAVMVAGHNAARRQAGEQPLAWNDKLSAGAAACAAELARSDRFEHCEDGQDDGNVGENLWMGTSAAYSYANMIDSWIDEQNAHGGSGSRARRISFAEAGHYTQVVWPETKYVGCAVSTGNGNEYLVCHYYPAGNVY